MDQAVQDMPVSNEVKSAVEIVVHVSDDLEAGQRSNLVAALESEDGIVAAEFCSLRNHLMVVRYDRDQCSSQDVLGAVRAQKLQASLIGPM